jgi:hypothetical protein
VVTSIRRSCDRSRRRSNQRCAAWPPSSSFSFDAHPFAFRALVRRNLLFLEPPIAEALNDQRLGGHFFGFGLSDLVFGRLQLSFQFGCVHASEDRAPLHRVLAGRGILLELFDQCRLDKGRVQGPVRDALELGETLLGRFNRSFSRPRTRD